jgi:hypothetical protein
VSRNDCVDLHNPTGNRVCGRRSVHGDTVDRDVERFFTRQVIGLVGTCFIVDDKVVSIELNFDTTVVVRLLHIQVLHYVIEASPFNRTLQCIYRVGNPIECSCSASSEVGWVLIHKDRLVHK